MSEGTRGGWKLIFRDDEIETLKLVLAHVISRHVYAIEERSSLVEIDLMAHRISKARVAELLEYIEQVAS